MDGLTDALKRAAGPQMPDGHYDDGAQLYDAAATEIVNLREILSCALGEHDDHKGFKLSDESDPHWSNVARQAGIT